MKLTSFLIITLMFFASCAQEPKTVSLEWGEIDPLPVAISNNAVAAAEVNDNWNLYSFLGIQSGKTYQDVSTYSATYSLDNGEWVQLSGVPDSLGRLGSTAKYANGYIYIFGGYTVAEDGSEVSTDQVFKFDPETRTYERVADMLISVEDAVALVYEDRYIYLVSGWNDTNNVSNVQVYDTETNSWEHATPYPGPPVFGHAGGIVGNTMVLSDGVQSKIDAGEKIFLMSPGSIKGVIDSNDPTVIMWSRIPTHPGAPRYRMASIGVESPVPMVIYIGGSENPYNYNGIGYNLKPAVPSKTVLAYRLDTEQWIELGEQPNPTMDHRGIAEAGDELYIIGGMGANQNVITRVQRITISAE